MRRVVWVAGGLAAVLLLVLFPLWHALLLGVNAAVHLFILGVQFVAARLPVRPPPRQLRPAAEEPFVSIHVPAHNEPPALLLETLDSLARLDWEHYEVLVMDNNTTDASLWRPVEAHCRALGSRFKFLHAEGLKGFKAGAMNHFRRFMNPEARFIFVVDADYVVAPEALRRAMAYVTDASVGLVQFPQHYRNAGPGNLGVTLDYRHFFSGYMAAANRLGCVPATGTLSFIRVSALKTVGGFNTQVVTEDAALGLQLNLAGFRTVYAPEIVGAGLMPHDLGDLKKQRWRWAFGNAQILRRHGGRIFLGRELHWKQKVGWLAHLTAWFNFNLVPSLSLLVLAGLAATGTMRPEQVYLVPVAGITLVTFYVLRFGVLFHSLRPEGWSLREIGQGFAAHVGLGWIFSTSWVKCLWNQRAPFVRTNKFLGRVPSGLQAMTAEMLLGVAMLAATVVLGVAGFVVGTSAAVLFCLARLSILGVAREMRWTHQATMDPHPSSPERVAPVFLQVPVLKASDAG
ncbi:MAG: glycosyltransferase [Verrucomicrobiae bacterium]|nr:glycosyltransferase [Verrucomicrobiae bacterium]